MIGRFMEDPKLFVVFALLIGVPLWLFIREIASNFDRGYWKKGSSPDPKAEIAYVSRKRVIYVKNGAKFKTTVDFTDGYRFVTHKTDREDGVFRYKISVDKHLASQIEGEAFYKHDKAVRRKLKKTDRAEKEVKRSGD